MICWRVVFWGGDFCDDPESEANRKNGQALTNTPPSIRRSAAQTP